MPQEIEHKFLLKNDLWRAQVQRSARMTQGYLQSSPASSIRVRIMGEHAFLNIKSATLGIERQEYEYAVPLADAEELLATLCEKPLIDKTRHYVEHAGHVWEIDEFYGDNAGLMVAEIELNAVDEAFELPEWVGENVSHEPKYYNSCLVKNPYSQWDSA